MAGKRRRCSAEFKAMVTLIHTRKRQAIEGMSACFRKAEGAAADRVTEPSKLHAKIEELVVERHALRTASGR